MSRRRYYQGDIIFVPYPFTDLSQTKKRPAIIISNDDMKGENYIVAKVTSNLKRNSFSFALNDSEIIGRLLFKSEVRTDEIFTVHESIIIRKFCTLKHDALQRLLNQVIANIS
ncbi:MAG: type II toxin-antitoxin system PemK/MazF family toxin [Chitinophagales bacterium]